VLNDGIVGDKDVSAVRRLEGDAQAGFCRDGVKVASNWRLHLAGAWFCAPSAPEKNLPNPVPHDVPTKRLKPLSLFSFDRRRAAKTSAEKAIAATS
jgi:hypothetical protein